jgi:hypothetical protein
VLFSGYQAQQNLDDPPCRVAVHREEDFTGFPLPGQHLPRGGDNLSRIRPTSRLVPSEIVTGRSVFSRRVKQGGINHHIADQENALAWPALFHEIGDRVFLRNKKVVGNRIRQNGRRLSLVGSPGK